MKVEHISYSGAEAERLLAESCDCLWVSFHGRRAVGPLESQSLQCVDWRMSGVLSRYVLQGEFRSKRTTFVPTMKKIAAQFLALESNGTPDWERFVQNCTGLKLKRVIFFCEDKQAVGLFQKELTKLSSHPYPETLLVASDG